LKKKVVPMISFPRLLAPYYAKEIERR